MTTDVDAVDFLLQSSNNVAVSGLPSNGTRQSEVGQGTPTDIKHDGILRQRSPSTVLLLLQLSYVFHGLIKTNCK